MERAFLRTKPYSMSVKYNAKTREHSLWFHVRNKPPVAFSLLMAEYVHQLRAALDNIAWEMAVRYLASQGKTRPPGRYTAFPVCLEPNDWDKGSTKSRIVDFPPAALSEVQDLQPYNGTDIVGPKSHRLWLLTELWNADKHRALVLTLGTASKLRIDFDKPCEIRGMWLKGFDKDRPLARVFAYGERQLQYKTKPPFRIGFGYGGPYLSGLVVVTNLSRLYQFVRHEALPRLKPFLV
jgi:hypothetical protein